MYLDSFGLRDFPFRLTPDTEFLYMSAAHTRAKAYMDYSVWSREGFVVITGEIGCGKTTLVKKLLTELEGENVLVAKIFQTQLDDVEFLQSVLVEFGLNPFNAKKVELIDMLNTFLIESYQNLKQLVLVVDDAHNLDVRALEEIRMLSGLETQKEKILHVILVGQPQLNEMLESPELEQLLQRVHLRFHLRPLSLEDTTAYVAYRMKVAGAERADIFMPETMPVLHKYTGGVPRMINTLCDTALTVAFADGLPTVTLAVLKEAIDELQWQPYDRRQAAMRAKAGTKSARHASAEARGRALADIGARLSQIDNLAQTLTLIADRMANIENLLSGITKHLRRERPASGRLETSSRKAGGKER